MLVFRLERDAQQPGLLVPSRLISTLSRAVTFVNDVPMELGCHYGGRYWKNKAKAESLQACLELSSGLPTAASDDEGDQAPGG